MTVRSITRLLFSAMVVAVLASFSTAHAAEPFELYVLTSTTGSAAFIGAEEVQSLHVLEGLVNRRGGIRGRPIHFTIADDQNNPAQAVQLANQLIAKHVPIILGPTGVGTCNALIPLVRNGPVVFCFAPLSGLSPDGFTFSGMVENRDYALSGMRYSRGQGWTRLALIASNDANGQAGSDAIRALLGARENQTLSLVGHEVFNVADLGVAAQISRLKATDPKVLFVWAVGTQFATVLRTLADANWDIPVITPAGNMQHAQMRQLATILPPQLYFTGLRFLAHDVALPGPVREAQNVFYASLKSSGVDEPDSGFSYAWDVALIAVDALNRLGADASASDIRQYLEQLHGFAGINGLVDFRGGSQHGIGVTSTVVIRWNSARDTWNTVSQPGGLPLRAR